MATVFIVLTGGAFLTGLALSLGASDFEIGLLGAIPFLAQALQLIGAYIIDLTGRKKLIAIRSLFIARQIWWLLLPLPLVKGEWRLTVLIAVLGLSSLAATMGAVGWISWIADLIPERVRGRYLGFRNAAIAGATIAATLTGGAILDHFEKSELGPYGFSTIITLACLFALGALIVMRRIPEGPRTRIENEYSWKTVLEPFSRGKFTQLITIFIVWNFALGVSAAFFAAHMLTNLKMSFTQISLYVSGASLVTVMLSRPWGAIIDRFGTKPVITLCAFGIAVVPLIWWFPRPGNLGVLAFEAVYSGALWAGFNLAAFNLPIAYSPAGNRTVYLSAISVTSGLAFFMASLMGGFLSEKWGWIHWQLGPQVIVNYHLLFGISSVLRLFGAFLILGFQDSLAKGVPVIVQYFGDSILKRLPISR